jgi:hypothetical protein
MCKIVKNATKLGLLNEKVKVGLNLDLDFNPVRELPIIPKTLFSTTFLAGITMKL